MITSREFPLSHSLNHDVQSVVRRHMEHAAKLRASMKVNMKVGRNWEEMETFACGQAPPVT